MFLTKFPSSMRFVRCFSSSRRRLKAPLIIFENASIYPLGETARPYFKDLNWVIHEQETWAVIGPASSGRRVLLEVCHDYPQLTTIGPAGKVSRISGILCKVPATTSTRRVAESTLTMAESRYSLPSLYQRYNHRSVLFGTLRSVQRSR